MFKKKNIIIINDKKNKRNIKKILLISLPIVFVLAIITLILSGNLSNLMNSTAWQINEYTIIYNSNGGSGEMERQESNVLPMLNPNQFTAPWSDAKFIGWHVYNDTTDKWLNVLYKLDSNNNITDDINYYFWDVYDFYHYNNKKNEQELALIPDEFDLNKLESVFSSCKGDDLRFVAVWDGTRTISFNANGGTGSMETIKISTAVSAIDSPDCSFKKPGYKCLGWKVYLSDRKGWYSGNFGNDIAIYSNYEYASFIDTSSMVGFSYKAGENIVLYAYWRPYKLKFYSNGGVGSMNEQDTNYGASTIIRANTFQNPGYIFSGWHARRLDINKWYCYTDSSKRNIAWVDKDVCETYGYYTYSDQQKLTDEDLTNMDGDVILYAQWGDTYTLKFNANGGIGSMSEQQLTYGVSTPISANTFTKTGYVFTGWHAKRDDGKWYCYTNPAKTSTGWSSQSTCNSYGYYLYKDKKSVSNTASPGGYTTMYAQWISNQFTLKFNGNGAAGSMSNQKIAYGVSTPISANTFTKTGYVFTGWHAKRDDGKWYCYTNPAKTSTGWTTENVCNSYGYYLYKDKKSVSNTASPGGYTTMYAQWKTNQFTLKFDGNGDTKEMKNQKITYGVSTPISANIFTKTGYVFTGWHAKRDDGKWYCYTNPAKTSTGWTNENICNSYGYYLYKDKQKVSNTANPGGYTTMYAQWQPLTYMLYFNANGGAGSMSNQKLKYGVSTPISANKFTRSGYKFIGWHAKRNDGKWYCYTNPAKTSTGWASQSTCNSYGYYLYKDKQKVSNTASPGGYTTMYAQWQENKFRVVYNANGGTGSMSDQRINYGVSTALLTNKFTKSGYKFIGWHAKRSDGTWYCNTDSTGKKRAWVKPSVCGTYGYYTYSDGKKVSDTASPGDFVVMYAQWKTNRFTVRFYPNGGTGTMNDQYITYGVSTKLSLNKFSKSGYKFVGWTATRGDGLSYCYTNPAKTSLDWKSKSTCGSFGYYIYSDGKKISDTVQAGGIVRMYAQWQKK